MHARLSEWYGIEIGPVGGRSFQNQLHFLLVHVLISEPVVSVTK